MLPLCRLFRWNSTVAAQCRVFRWNSTVVMMVMADCEKRSVNVAMFGTALCKVMLSCTMQEDGPVCSRNLQQSNARKS